MNSLSEEVMARFDGIEGHLSALRVGRSAPTLSANGPIVETAPVVRSDVGDGNSRPVAVDQDPNVEHYETMGVLGEISSEGKAEKGGRENVVAAVMLSVDQNPNSSLTPEESYDAAYQLLRRADYGQAELALRVFIENYPDHELSGNAFYWLGETFYVRDDYENAKRAFAQGYKKFPTGPKAPDILLKLGMSFRGAMDDANACVIFKELNDDHPNAPAVIITRLEQERAKAGCQ
jgi:tol-pal system protein YbgF